MKMEITKEAVIKLIDDLTNNIKEVQEGKVEVEIRDLTFPETINKIKIDLMESFIIELNKIEDTTEYGEIEWDNFFTVKARLEIAIDKLKGKKIKNQRLFDI